MSSSEFYREFRRYLKRKKNQEYRLRNAGKHTPPGLIGAFPSYMGGCTTTCNGYVYEFYPSHPRANRWGYMHQHRLIAEREILGRYLNPHEVVHHIDENRTNNAVENLQVMTQTEHRSHHAKELALRMAKPLDRDEVVALLKKHRAVKPAAAELGVNHQTLRNRFPDLCEPFQRTRPVHIDASPYLSEIREAAADTSISLRQLSQWLKISISTIDRICEQNGIEWQRKNKAGRKHFRRRKHALIDLDELREYRNNVQKVREAAADHSISLAEIAAEFDVSGETIRRICKTHGIQWQSKRRKSDKDLADRQKAIELGQRCVSTPDG